MVLSGLHRCFCFPGPEVRGQVVEHEDEAADYLEAAHRGGAEQGSVFMEIDRSCGRRQVQEFPNRRVLLAEASGRGCWSELRLARFG